VRILKIAQISERELLLADDFAKRGHAWRGLGTVMHDGLQRWHDVYAKSVTRAFGTLTPSQIRQLVDSLLVPNVQVHLLSKCSHFDYAFSLNRWVVSFLGKLIASSPTGDGDTFRPNFSLSRIESADMHVCSSAASCHGKPHLAFVKTSSCNGFVQQGTAESILGTYDAVIVRHGIHTSKLFGTAAVAEQLVPYTVPH
jgi:hypothetical protein